jgi:hypothetical protein
MGCLICICGMDSVGSVYGPRVVLFEKEKLLSRYVKSGHFVVI